MGSSDIASGLPVSLAVEQGVFLHTSSRVALGGTRTHCPAATQQWHLDLAELGSSIFISDNSNGERGGNISSNLLPSLSLFVSLSPFPTLPPSLLLGVRGHRSKKEQQKGFVLAADK